VDEAGSRMSPKSVTTCHAPAESPWAWEGRSAREHSLCDPKPGFALAIFSCQTEAAELPRMQWGQSCHSSMKEQMKGLIELEREGVHATSLTCLTQLLTPTEE